MTKKIKGMVLALAAMLLMAPGASMAQDVDQQALLDELRALKARVTQLEDKLSQAQRAADDAAKAAQEARATSSHSLKVSQEVAKTKESGLGGLLSEAGKRINVYGAVELEGAYSNYKPQHGESSSESQFSVATAEIFFEAAINEYTTGLIHLLYENEGDALNVDEAFIVLGQTDDVPAYFMGGRIYPAVGLFETFMVSDPITQNMFEVQATAAEVGWSQDWFNVGIGAYNSDVHQTDDGSDNLINTFYARLQLASPEGALGEDTAVSFGVAYTNNIAAGNLSEELETETIRDLVGGWSAMLSIQYKMFAFTGEYIAATDDFQSGELSFGADERLQPMAYNLELACMPWDAWTFAVRFEGSSDSGSYEPEQQYGAAVGWTFLPDTTLSLEYLHGNYENDDERDIVTTQLAVGF